MEGEETDDHHCTPCKKVFKDKYTRNRHMVKKHKVEPTTEEKQFKCTYCDKSYGERSGIRKHLKSAHPDHEQLTAEKTQKELIIDVCEGGSNRKKASVYSCTVVETCSFTAKTRETLVSHCQQVHPSFGHHLQTKTFECYEDAQEFINCVEKNSCTSFSRRNVTKYAEKVYEYYYCHREGEPPDDQRRKANKCTMTCTAFMKIIRSDDDVTLTYCDIHSGHEVSRARLPLTVREKDLINYWIAEDKTEAGILNRCRASGPDSRLYYVNKGDLRKMTAEFFNGAWKLHSDDHTSLAMRFAKEQDGLVSFSPATDAGGAGFRLVIITEQQREWLRKYSQRGFSIDATHNASRFEYKLSTLMLLDEADRSLPAAFFISASTTGQDYKQFFLEIKRVCPEFDPSAIFTDDDNSFYNGYMLAFPDSDISKHLCVWHVQKAIGENALKKIKNKSLLGSVRSSIHELFHEPRKACFLKKLLSLLTHLHNNGEETFLSYMRENYVGRVEEWAPWARLTASFNTTMVNESFHSVLKNKYLQKSENCRIDYVVHLLLSIPPAMLFEHRISDERGFLGRSFRIRLTTQSHAKSLKEFTSEDVMCRDGALFVKSSNRDHHYEVLKKDICKCDEQNNVHCYRCHACPYSWQCTCPEGAKKGVVCKHVHVLHIYGFHLQPDTDDVTEDELLNNIRRQCAPAAAEDSSEVPDGSADSVQEEEENGDDTIQEEENGDDTIQEEGENGDDTIQEEGENGDDTIQEEGEEEENAAKLYDRLKALNSTFMSECYTASKEGDKAHLRRAIQLMENETKETNRPASRRIPTVGRPKNRTRICDAAGTLKVLKRTQKPKKRICEEAPFPTLNGKHHQICASIDCYRKDPDTIIADMPEEDLPFVDWLRCTNTPECGVCYHYECRKVGAACDNCNSRIGEWYEDEDE